MADEQEPKTRTRQGQSAKAEQTQEENSAAEQRKAEAAARAEAKEKQNAELKAKREAEKKEREEKRAAEKAEREAKREEEKKRKEEEREEAKRAKEQEKITALQQKIESGEVIYADTDRNLLEADTVSESNGDVITYTATEPKKEQVAQRARDIIQRLIDEATEVPYPGKDLADEFGGGTVQWVSFFGMLRVLGYVKPYRFRGAGEAGLAYKWVGPTDIDLDQLSAVAEGEMDEAEAEPVA